MSSNSILVTGGAGFIGSEFVRQTLKESIYDKVFVLDKLTYAGDLNRIIGPLNRSEIDFIECDVNTSQAYSSILKEVSHIVHFAAESHVDRSNEDGLPFLHTNVLGTYKLLEAARYFSRIRTLLVSTDEVYGSINQGETSETSMLNPSSAYSASKTSSDLIGIAMFRTFNQDIVITRGCNTYGPHQHYEKFIPLCISRFSEGLKAPLYGDGLNIREWIHVSDHAIGIRAALEAGKSGQVYNIGSGMRLTNKAVLELLLQNFGLNWDSVEYVSDRQGHDYRYALNSSKIRKELHWSPRIEFNEGFSDTVKWYRESQSKI